MLFNDLDMHMNPILYYAKCSRLSLFIEAGTLQTISRLEQSICLEGVSIGRSRTLHKTKNPGWKKDPEIG